MKCFVIATAVVIITALGANAQHPTKNEGAEDKTGEVFGGIAELSIQRDRALRKYAFVATGEKHATGAGRPPDRRGFYAIKIVDLKRQFEYIAHCDVRVAEYIGRPTDLQSWTEKCQCNGRIHVDGGPINSNHIYKSPGPEEKIADFLRKMNFDLNHLDPFDNICMPGTNFESPIVTIHGAEKIFLNQSTLVSSRFDGFGNVISEWDCDLPSYSLDLRLVQGKSSDFLPIEIEMKGTEGWSKDFFSFTRCKWRKDGEQYLPVRIESACTSYIQGKPVTNQWFFKLDWLVGDRVPDEFFERDSFDYREPIRRHFDLSFDQFIPGLGSSKADPWELPEELLEDWPVLLKQE